MPLPAEPPAAGLAPPEAELEFVPGDDEPDVPEDAGVLARPDDPDEPEAPAEPVAAAGAVDGAPPLAGADEPAEPLAAPEPTTPAELLEPPALADPVAPLAPATDADDVVLEVVVLAALAAVVAGAVGTVSSDAPDVLLFVFDGLLPPHAEMPTAIASAASSDLRCDETAISSR